MSERTLVRTLFDGPIDIVGDVHGEIEALHGLRRQLGYSDRGVHPEGRRLVFVGDLGDRGPDSPGVIEWIRDLVERGRAQCVLGNHDFNALSAARGGSMKTELSWLFDEAPPLHYRGRSIPQTLVRGRRRDDLLAFLASLPVALERGGDQPVRVVHACWDQTMIDRLRQESDVVAVHRRDRQTVEASLQEEQVVDPLERKLAFQNRNAVKRVLAGAEARLTEPVVINNEPRWEGRVPWWHDYQEEVLCVFGHYWRTPLEGEGAAFHLFDGDEPNELVGPGGGMCVDYSVGKRYRERLRPEFDGTYRTSLAALRLPEQVLYFDNAAPLPVQAVRLGSRA